MSLAAAAGTQPECSTCLNFSTSKDREGKRVTNKHLNHNKTAAFACRPPQDACERGHERRQLDAGNERQTL